MMPSAPVPSALTPSNEFAATEYTKSAVADWKNL